MTNKALALIFWIGSAIIGSFIILFVFLMFYLIALGIISVVHLLQ